MGVEALLFPREPDLDGPAGVARQERAEYGESSRDLDTKSAAEIRGHDPHGFHRQAQDPSRTVLETIRVLHRTPERARAVFIDSNAGARLMRDGIDLRLSKGPLDHNVALGETLLQVPSLVYNRRPALFQSDDIAEGSELVGPDVPGL